MTKTALTLVTLGVLASTHALDWDTGVFGENDATAEPEHATYDDEAASASLDERDLEQIEGAVENMAQQFKAQLTEHITEQMRQSKLGSSKLGQSQVASKSVGLHMAVSNNQYEKVVKLLESGSDPNAATASGMSPLHVASEEGNLQVVACFIN